MLTYEELLKRKDAPAGSSWGLFGADDELGTVNLLTPERVADAARCIRRGVTFNLDCHLAIFDPPTSHQRKPLRHSIFAIHPHHRDDCLDSYYLQSGSQIDSLRHLRHPVHGFYNGAPDDSIGVGTARNGISRYAEHGMVGRGLLLDVDRYLRAQGKPLDHRAGEPFSHTILEETAAAQKSPLRPGDIVMIRTGFLHHYFHDLSQEERENFPKGARSAGLVQSHDSLAWMWDNQIAVLAADNPGVEAVPPIAASPFAKDVAGTPGVPSDFVARLMHPYMIAMLGLALGELWDLDKLAEDCARDGVYECFVSLKPLNLIGGVGSPANGVAIK